MKNLHLDIDQVPIIHRVRVTDATDGEVVAETTMYIYPAELSPEWESRVRVGFAEQGYPDIKIEYWPA